MTALERARASWGEPLPEWIEALAAAADRLGQREVARILGYSAPVVSQVLASRYPGSLRRIEFAVGGAFLARRCKCPGQQWRPIRANECLAWQRRPYDGGNHVAVRMYRACRGGCAHSMMGES